MNDTSKNILIVGGAGYVGAVLVPDLLNQGYKITVYDLMIYGENVLQKHENLKIIKGDIRNIDFFKNYLVNQDTIIHLACISNDPSFELNPQLGKSINLDSFQPIVNAASLSSVNKFIFASSSSVYGVKEDLNVHEMVSLEPLTDYSKYKAECERILLDYNSNDFTTIVVRPATVCGYSPRQRLDVVVNIFANLAYHKRKISVFGGNQLRPNIHIKDMAEVYSKLLKSSKSLVSGQIFNAGYENKTILELANIVKKVIGDDVLLDIAYSNDNRSYHISSKKIKEQIGFETKYKISDAVQDIKKAFEKNLLPNSLDDEKYFNIKKMQALKLV